uniref:Calmodulin n=1 Tax=Haptolina brevifila TaxID=156173 RepID=A0A7S2H0Y4_9EUKA
MHHAACEEERPRMGCAGGKAIDGDGAEDGAKFAEIKARGWKIEDKAIGEGGFGTVHLCTSTKNGKQRACKAMRLRIPEDRADFRAEVRVLEQVRKHKNICHLIDHAEDSKYGYLVMQSCTGGELFDRIAARNCSERDAAMAVVDVLSALNYLHNLNIVHRDLKPENLLYKDKAPGAPIKLIDFGLAIQLGRGQKGEEVCGTTSYMAPEVLNASYSTECDIWSLGVITYFMLSGQLPFKGKEDEDKEKSILKGHVSFSSSAWSKISDAGKDFVKQLLVSPVSQRLSGKDALKHKWIKGRAELSSSPQSDEVVQSLKKYAGAHKFEKAVRHSMATHLTSMELHKLRNTFEELDEEGAGNISIDSLQKILSKESASGRDLFAGFDVAAFDIDGDGQVDWREFVAAVMQDHELYNEENLAKVFAEADTNKDGTLSHAEISKMLGNDHEFSREILQKVQASRGTSHAEEVHMTLAEFKSIMQPSESEGADKAKSKTGKRKHHAPVSSMQMAAGGEEKI